MFVSANAAESEKSNAVVMREEVAVASIVEALVMLVVSSCVYVQDSPDFLYVLTPIGTIIQYIRQHYYSAQWAFMADEQMATLFIKWTSKEYESLSSSSASSSEQSPCLQYVAKWS